MGEGQGRPSCPVDVPALGGKGTHKAILAKAMRPLDQSASVTQAQQGLNWKGRKAWATMMSRVRPDGGAC